MYIDWFFAADEEDILENYNYNNNYKEGLNAKYTILFKILSVLLL